MGEEEYDEDEHVERANSVEATIDSPEPGKNKDQRYDFEIFNDPKTFKDVCRRNKFNQLIKSHNLKVNHKQHKE